MGVPSVFVIQAGLAASSMWAAEGGTSPGSLVIVGGGRLPAEVGAKFVELAGGRKARIVVIPTASVDADDAKKHDSFLKQWKDRGAASVELLHSRDRGRADDATFVKPIREATAVWLSGGDQNRLIEAYRGTLVEKELHKLIERGGVIGGTSAGAAVMSDVMIQGGRDQGVRTGPGFGFVKGIVVDQHFANRNRVGRLRYVLSKNPGHGGLGIDEGTAAVIKGGKATIIGVGAATAIDAATSPQSKRERKLPAGASIELGELRPRKKAA